MTRNHVGFARAGSNPAAHVFCMSYLLLLLIFNYYLYCFSTGEGFLNIIELKKQFFIFALSFLALIY
ncbi:hypothetical protein KSP40_PGU002010 [Platanthera guangdongensis]|uniref:Uncharacterized protein n=1 Tax=Platanthera guangdongensis TaxID=2320717 RepID=A0ABR2MXB7_9ASPA